MWGLFGRGADEVLGRKMHTVTTSPRQPAHGQGASSCPSVPENDRKQQNRAGSCPLAPYTLLQIRQHILDLSQCSAQVICDFFGEYVRVGQVGGVLEALVAQPKDV